MRYFEDLERGDSFELGQETLTSEDIVEFAEQFDPQPFHLGEAGSEGSVFDGHVASGLHTLSIGSRLLVEGVLLDVDNMGDAVSVPSSLPTRSPPATLSRERPKSSRSGRAREPTAAMSTSG